MKRLNTQQQNLATSKTLTANRSKVNIKSDFNSKRHKSHESNLVNQENKLNTKNVNQQVNVLEKIDKIDYEKNANALFKKIVSPEKTFNLKSNTSAYNKCFNVGNKSISNKCLPNDQFLSKLIVNRNNTAKKLIKIENNGNKAEKAREEYVQLNSDVNSKLIFNAKLANIILEDGNKAEKAREEYVQLNSDVNSKLILNAKLANIILENSILGLYKETYRDSKVIDDFYTNSIAEADCSLNDKEGITNFINKIPTPFVKQETKESLQKNVKLPTQLPTPNKNEKLNEISIKNSYDFAKLNKEKKKNSQKSEFIYKDYLNLARKGDKDGFLSTVELYVLIN